MGKVGFRFSILLTESVLGRRSMLFSLVLFLISGSILYTGTVASFIPAEQAIAQTVNENNPDLILSLSIGSNWTHEAQNELTLSIESMDSISNASPIIVKNVLSNNSAAPFLSNIIGVNTQDLPFWMQNGVTTTGLLDVNETLVDESYRGVLEIGSILTVFIPITQAQNSELISINLTVAGYASFQDMKIETGTSQPVPFVNIFRTQSPSIIVVDIGTTLEQIIVQDDSIKSSYVFVEVENEILWPYDTEFLSNRLISIENSLSQQITEPFHLNRVIDVLRSRLSLIADSSRTLSYWALTSWFILLFTTYIVVSYSSKSSIKSNQIEISRLMTRGVKRKDLASSLKTTICMLAAIGGLIGSFLAIGTMSYFGPTLQGTEFSEPHLTINPVIFLMSSLVIIPIAYFALIPSIASIMKSQVLVESNSTEESFVIFKNRIVRLLIIYILCYAIFPLVFGVTPLTLITDNLGYSMVSFLLLLIFGFTEAIFMFAGEIIVIVCSIAILLYFIGNLADLIDSISRRLGLLYHSSTRIISESFKVDVAPIVIIFLMSTIVVTSSLQVMSTNNLEQRSAEFYAGADASITLKPNTNASVIVDNLSTNMDTSHITIEHTTAAYIDTQMTQLRFVDTDRWLDIAYYELEWFASNPQSIINGLGANQILLSLRTAKVFGINTGDYVSITNGQDSSFIISLEVIGYLQFRESLQYGLDFSILNEETLDMLNDSFVIEPRILLATDSIADISFLEDLAKNHNEITGVLIAEPEILPIEYRVLIQGRLYLTQFLLNFTWLISIVMFFTISWFLIAQRSREMNIIRKRGVSRTKSIRYMSSGIILWFMFIVAISVFTAGFGFASSLIFRNVILGVFVSEILVLESLLIGVVCSLVVTYAMGGIIASVSIMKREGM
ncbi:MAG: FtsX-like permease family protein [Candidatus Thorarchaeota archaeon]